MTPTFPSLDGIETQPVLVHGIPVRLGELLSGTGKARTLPGAFLAAEYWHTKLTSETRDALAECRRERACGREALAEERREYARGLFRFVRDCHDIRVAVSRWRY